MRDILDYRANRRICRQGNSVTPEQIKRDEAASAELLKRSAMKRGLGSRIEITQHECMRVDAANRRAMREDFNTEFHERRSFNQRLAEGFAMLGMAA